MVPVNKEHLVLQLGMKPLSPEILIRHTSVHPDRLKIQDLLTILPFVALPPIPGVIKFLLHLNAPHCPANGCTQF